MPNVCKNSSNAIFADDTTLTVSGKRMDNVLNVNFCRTSKRRACKNLTNEEAKCGILFFGYGKPSNILVNNTVFAYKNSIKTPGVYVDENLTFREHMD